MSEYSPASTGEEHVIFMTHDARAMIEAQLWDDLQYEVERGAMTEQEAEDTMMEWHRLHDGI